MTPTPAYPSGTVTFLFSDIEGSTRLWEHDAAAMRPALERHDQIMRSAIEANRGVVFKTVGDAFCAAFSRADDALAAAVAAQRGLNDQVWGEATGPLRVRMGIHTGTAVESDGDYFGPTVNRVARLMSIGYGEQILVSSVSASLLRGAVSAGVTLRDLGTHRLKDLSEPESTFQVVADGLRSAFPALRSLDSRPNNLPFQISSFVGRERELNDVREALAHHRLVTIVGPGGIGKTRLALQAAGDLIDAVKDGAWLVQLSPLRHPELIPQAAAEVLRIRETPQERLEETLARTLAASEMLVIFDSSEHLLGPTAAFVKLLLNRCAALKVLVTSREPLHLTGECVVRITALENARELFYDRARDVSPGFRFDESDAHTIDEICTRLEGIPLAIELAAARVATLPIAELNARLSRRLSLLVSRDSTVEERHRTLRGTIAWSEGLLESRDAAVFRALAAFRGTFDCAAVTAVSCVPEDEVLDALEALADKSLVSSELGPLAARYVLLDTVAEYLVAVSAESGSLDDVCRRHFGYYERFASSMTVQAGSGEIETWLNTIATEIGNLRAALEWGIRKEPSEAAVLLCNLSRYLKIRGQISEGRSWFRRFLADPRVADPARAALLRRAATFATEQDDYDEARALSEECRDLFGRLGDASGVGEALHNLAVIEHRRGDVAAAAERYTAALEQFRRARNEYGAVMTVMNLVLLAFEREDLGEAERRIDEAVVATGRMENADLRATLAAFRGSLALRRGDLEEAIRLILSALEVKRTLGNRHHVADIQNTLAHAYMRSKRPQDARASAGESLRLALQLEAGSLVIHGFEAFCEIAAGERRFDEAARYCGLARALRRTHTYRSTNARKMSEIEALLSNELGERFEVILAGCADADWRQIAAGLAAEPS